jgi:CSLREA domain-containing protein
MQPFSGTGLRERARSAAPLGLALVLGLTFGTGRVATPATFTVTTADDHTDGTCNAADCTLREAMDAANDAGGDNNTIVLQAGGPYVLSLSLGSLRLQDDTVGTTTTVNGNGQTIDGGGVSSVLRIGEGKVVLNDLTIQNGNTGSSGRGIEIRFGAVVEMNRCVVRNNATDNVGGGIWVEFSSLALNETQITGNTASAGGGLANVGDASTPVTVSRSTISGNESWGYDGGGGILNGGLMTLDETTVKSNVATDSGSGYGGGIRNVGKLTITRSVIHDNTTHATNEISSGGGIYNGGCYGSVCPLVMLTLTNSTVSGNTAVHDADNVGSSGGGIRNSGGEVTLDNTTVSRNTATDGGGISSGGGTVVVRNTIIAQNATADCAGTITSLGHNLDGGVSCALSGPGDLSAGTAALGPLQDNGGPTWTHALLPGSAAIDAGDPNTCQPIDQRGVARPQGPVCDIGAYEAQPVTVGHDHFLGYAASNLNPQTIGLEDQFGLSTYRLVHTMDLRLFFNPVDKNGEGIPQPDHHLAGYKIVNDPGLVGFVDVEIENQFGTQTMTVDLFKTTMVLVPTRKEGHPAPTGLDHYKCYRVHPNVPATIDQPVTLDDQWIDPSSFKVATAFALCAPVTKSIGDVTVPPENPFLHYVQYRLMSNLQIIRTPYIDNQFDGGLIKARNPRWLLVPSTKKVL